MTKTIKRFWLSLWCALLVAFANPVLATDATDDQGVAETTDSVEQDVQEEAGKQAAERRNKIMQEAVDALAQTKDALKALEEERIDDALDALAVTIGKLELIVAREPSLALAPTDISIVTHDLYGTEKAIKAAIDRAENALEDGDVQKARRILSGLGSEMVITVANLPLATFPDAIKAVTPQIDAGEIDEAKAALQAALNTMVLTDHVLPLPVLRSEALLKRAEELASNAERSDDENEELNGHLAAARNQLEMARLLGYGDKDQYRSLFTQLKKIEKNTSEGQSATSQFDEMKASMSELWHSILS